jgi:hypothetical protein
MKNKTAGLLVGVGAGLGLAWLVRPRDRATVVVDVTLKTAAGGRCGVMPVADVELHYDQKIEWRITNNCAVDVRLALERWRDNAGNPRCAPVNPDDAQEPHLWRKVKAGRSGTIKGRGRLDWFGSDYHYDIYIDDKLAVDPIVRLVL